MKLGMLRALRCLICLSGLWIFAADAAENVRSIQIGIVPYLSPQVLMSLFAPVREHLQEELGVPVQLYTATDVPTFISKSLHNDYDVVIASAHFSRLLQLRASYQPLVQFSSDLFGSVLVARNSPLRQLTDLRQHCLAITDRTILVNLVIFKALADKRIKDSDLILHLNASQNTALLMVAQKDCDAAITAHFALDQMLATPRSELREIYRTEALPNMFISASKKLTETQRNLITQAMFHLSSTLPGQQFFSTSKFGGIQRADMASMKKLDQYLPETLKYLGLK
jgi:phosphonate transport system substrate-binding protein